MRELLPSIHRWQSEDKKVALATVVKAYGSAPRPLGSKMAVSSSAEMAGSVSGGCVESAVLQEALDVLEKGRPRLIAFGIADEWAQGVGLACGGNIEVYLEPIDPTLFPQLEHSLESDQIVAQATVIDGAGLGRKLLVWPEARVEGDLGSDELNEQVIETALSLLVRQKTERLQFELGEALSDVFIEVLAPPLRLIIVGAVHIAIPLVTFANELDFHTTVVDVRSAFATPERFAHADRLILKWPDEALAELALNETSYVAVLSHDDKLDVPALLVALQSPARYIGALGSRKTMAKRAAKLREQGIDEEQLARIHNPIGLDLGGRRPEEIALAIMAEIVRVKNGMDTRVLS